MRETPHHGVVTKCFAYCRVSGKGQIEGDGFPRQKAAIRAYAKINEFRIVRWFLEEGVSGTIETMNRPAWAEMLTALHADGVRTIVVETSGVS
jgi:DNA invertase Pin-like site-specific DNA recombinase